MQCRHSCRSADSTHSQKMMTHAMQPLMQICRCNTLPKQDDSCNKGTHAFLQSHCIPKATSVAMQALVQILSLATFSVRDNPSSAGTHSELEPCRIPRTQQLMQCRHTFKSHHIRRKQQLMKCKHTSKSHRIPKRR